MGEAIRPTKFERILIDTFCRGCPCVAHRILMDELWATACSPHPEEAFYAACEEVRHRWARCPLNGNVDLGRLPDARRRTPS